MTSHPYGVPKGKKMPSHHMNYSYGTLTQLMCFASYITFYCVKIHGHLPGPGERVKIPLPRPIRKTAVP